jgi:uncharacterized protein (DUF934 family)
MQKLINKESSIDNPWVTLKEATEPEALEAVRGKNLIVPLKFWKLFKAELSGDIGVWLDSDEKAEEIGEDLNELPLIALNFPAFSDGRSYSTARELRQRFSYKGEIRAIGDVLQDQLYYMSQCGFDTFELRPDQDSESCLQAFADFKTGYQATIAEPNPLFRRR